MIKLQNQRIFMCRKIKFKADQFLERQIISSLLRCAAIINLEIGRIAFIASLVT